MTEPASGPNELINMKLGESKWCPSGVSCKIHPLALATILDDPRLVEYLLKKGGDPTRADDTCEEWLIMQIAVPPVYKVVNMYVHDCMSLLSVPLNLLDTVPCSTTVYSALQLAVFMKKEKTVKLFLKISSVEMTVCVCVCVCVRACMRVCVCACVYVPTYKYNMYIDGYTIQILILSDERIP